MIIGVDAGCLGVTDNRLKAGVYIVTYHLLLELAGLDKKNTYYLYSFCPIEQSFMDRLSKNFHNHIIKPNQGFMQIGIPLQMTLYKADVFLGLSQAMPFYHPFYTIGFIHGLDFNSSYHSPYNYKRLVNNSKYLIKHANLLVTSSTFLKNSLKNNYRKSAVVAPLGVDSVFFSNTIPYKMDRPYFLFVGTLKPSKNILRILEAFTAFINNKKKKFYFLFIGSDFWADAAIRNYVVSSHLEHDVIFIPYIPHRDLPTYYKGACAFVSPALYEGFGLPYLEALAQQCPIIAARNATEKEIIGHYATLVNPTNTNEITEALYTAANNKRKIQTMRKGMLYAKTFTWKRYAQQILYLINDKKHV